MVFGFEYFPTYDLFCADESHIIIIITIIINSLNPEMIGPENWPFFILQYAYLAGQFFGLVG